MESTIHLRKDGTYVRLGGSPVNSSARCAVVVGQIAPEVDAGEPHPPCRRAGRLSQAESHPVGETPEFATPDQHYCGPDQKQTLARADDAVADRFARHDFSEMAR